MKPAARLTYLLSSYLLISAAAQAQPSIPAGGVVNGASYAHAGLPNSGIAQGSLFSIFGSALGPASSPAIAFPLATALGGVSIQVSQGSTSVAAIPVYVGGTQINAIMPSGAPLGADTLTVTYQGQTSPGVAVQVVAGSFGIFSVNALGAGQGIYTTATYQLIGYNAAAHPGDTLVMWGTGLGAIAGGDENPPPVGNITSNGPVIYVGGVPVTPSYHGRSGCCSGLDQIVFQVPANVTGCNVPIAVQIGTTVSNFTSIALAASGSACADPSGVSNTLISQLAAKGSAAVGSIFYQTYNFTSPGFPLLGGGNSVTTGTQALADFEKLQFTDPTAFAPVLNTGACSVFSFNGTSASVPGLLTSTGLDAGSAITVTGAGAQGQLTTSSSITGLYIGRFSLPGGNTYTFTGPGGKDVGAFTVALPLQQQSLAWTNEAAITNIQRASGVTVTWTGADPAGTVQITGYSSGGGSIASAFGAGFTCTAPGAAGQFTVPAIVLLALPPSANLNTSLLNIPTGSLGISSNGAGVPFTATGLDIAEAFAQATITNSTVIYQ